MKRNFPDGPAAVAAAEGSPLLPVDERKVDERIAKTITSLLG